MKKKYLFVIDGEVQSSLFKPWQRALLSAGATVDIFDFESEFKDLNYLTKSWLVRRIYSWARKKEQRFIWQSMFCFLIYPIYWIAIFYTNRRLKKEASNCYSTVLVFKGLDMQLATLKYLKNIGSKVVCLNGDSPYNMKSSNYNVLSCIGDFDMFLCWSKIEQADLRAKGFCNTYFLPFSCEAVDSSEDPNFGFDLERSVVFIGAWDSDRENFLQQLNLENLIIFGPRWEKAGRSFLSAHEIYSERLSLNQMAFIYESSLCALNFLRPQNVNSHNMKTFEITGMGCFMIAPNTFEHRIFFDAEDSVALFDNIDEIPTLINKILVDSPDRIKERVLATKRKVLEHHSYKARVAELHQHLYGTH